MDRPTVGVRARRPSHPQAWVVPRGRVSGRPRGPFKVIHQIRILCLLLLFAFLSGGQVLAQGFYVKLKGKVTDHFTGDPMKGVQVRVLKAGQEEKTMMTRPDGVYEFKLDRGWRYAIWFSKDGFVSKHVNVDTEEIPPYPDVPFFDMDVQMTLFEWIPDFDFALFDLALGEASYKQSVRNMSWDVEYTEFMRPSLGKMMDEYEKTYKGYYKRNKGRLPPKVVVPMALQDSTDKGTLPEGQ